MSNKQGGEMEEKTARQGVKMERPTMPSSSLQGRAEAVQIIMSLEAESGLDDYITSYPLADSGDYEAVWDEKKLKELFHIGNEYENSPGAKITAAADELYWEAVSHQSDMETMKGLVESLLAQIERGSIAKGPWCTVEILKTWIA